MTTPQTDEQTDWQRAFGEYWWQIGPETKDAIVGLLPDDWSFEGKRMLDFGSGPGRTLREFLPEAQTAEFWGVDIDGPSIDYLRETVCPPMHAAQCAYSPPMDFEPGSFDLAWAISVFTHLTDNSIPWLLELHRVLKPGGLLIANYQGRWTSELIAGEPWDEDRVGMNVLRHSHPWDDGGPLVLISDWWLREHWGRAFEVVEIAPQHPQLELGAAAQARRRAHRRGRRTARRRPARDPGPPAQPRARATGDRGRPGAPCRCAARRRRGARSRAARVRGLAELAADPPDPRGPAPRAIATLVRRPAALASLAGGSVASDVHTDDRGVRSGRRDLLRTVAEGTAGAVGDEFLRCLVRHVALAFDAKFAFVAEATDPSGEHVRVLSGWYADDWLAEPFEYDTDGKPCALVVERSVVAFPEALTERFPEAKPAIEMGLESYLAVCLRAADGTHLGHVGVMDAGPMEAEDDDVAAMRIFASRAAAELERRQQAVALRRSRERVIGAADAERRRVGRDLHDGAQQRLAAVANLLRAAQLQFDRGGDAGDTLRFAHDELGAAQTELRELARGLHPVALSERGLRSALESLHRRIRAVDDARRRGRRSAGRTSSSRRTSSSASRS